VLNLVLSERPSLVDSLHDHLVVLVVGAGEHDICVETGVASVLVVKWIFCGQPRGRQLFIWHYVATHLRFIFDLQ
jgi:hypothetical protein